MLLLIVAMVGLVLVWGMGLGMAGDQLDKSNKQGPPEVKGEGKRGPDGPSPNDGLADRRV